MNIKLLANFILFTLIFSFQSCQSKPKEESQAESSLLNTEEVISPVKKEFYNLEIREFLNKPEEILLSNFTNEVQYIPLETTSACLISKVSELKIYNHNIFVLDKQKGLFKFNKEGKFIQQIGRRGNGPGEYGMVFRFNIFEESNEIIIQSFGRKISVYDLETGNHKRSFRLKFDANGIIEFPSGHISLFLPQDSKQPLNNEIYICDLQGQKIDSIPDSRLPRISGKHMTGLPKFYTKSKSLYYMNSVQDTLQILSGNMEKKKAYLILGLNNPIKSNELKMELIFDKIQFPDFLMVDNILENDKFFFVSVQQGIGFHIEGEIQRFLFDKASERLTNTPHLSNNIDEGMPFWPEYMNNNNELISVFNSYQVIEHLQSNTTKTDKSESFKNMATQITENDNPVVMIVKLKE